ncbi:2-C-methyl-D-erythritol 4-phosphate cytidylyltransferase [subsurface metagenome]
MPDTSEKVGAVIVAAGQSERMGDVDKMFALLGGQPLLLRVTLPFQQCSLIDRIVVVVSGEKETQCRSLVAGPDWSKVSDVCLGGRRRQDSVAEGLKHLADCDWAVIHDGARPLVTVATITAPTFSLVSGIVNLSLTYWSLISNSAKISPVGA